MRDYSSIATPDERASREQRMGALVDALWEALSAQGVSWIGFYLGPGQALEDGRVVGAQEMLLGPCRNKPACSPIGLHGVCGRSWRERRTIVVGDVEDLGAEYVACDPRDRSEVVVPLFDERGACYGVLDADSFDLRSFDERDGAELFSVLDRAGLTRRGVSGPGTLVI
jgi:putative methionine-R-sulfoxide reductase with GAF domain